MTTLVTFDSLGKGYLVALQRDMIQRALTLLEKWLHSIWTGIEVEIEETNSKVLGKGEENEIGLI